MTAMAPDRFEVEVNGQTLSKFVSRYHGALPGLILSDGATEVVFTAGVRRHETRSAREFAINLAFNALAFANECSGRLSVGTRDWPEDDRNF